jgi:hypothetical protein
VRHSASNDVDLPAYLALYEWVFSPSKDESGVARRDVKIVEFTWR